MRVLVTGGAGYVGSHVVSALLEAGHEPVVYDNLSTGHSGAVVESELIVGDVRDVGKLGSTLVRRKFDGVIHLAATSLVGESMIKPSLYFDNNVAGGLKLFDQLVAHEVPWIVISSTAAVYGSPESVPIDEDHAKLPTNPYGESKLMLERVLAWYCGAYGLRSVALRYFNAAGADPLGRIGEDHAPETHLVPIVLQAALGKREAVSLFGTDYPTTDGTAVRDYVHVCDLAQAHLRAIEQLYGGAKGGAYNLGSTNGFSVKEVIDMAGSVTGRTIPVRTCPRRPGDPAVLVARAAKALRELGWKPQFDLKGIIETAWNWHSNHPGGFCDKAL